MSNELSILTERFLQYANQRYAATTLKSIHTHSNYFFRWCCRKQITQAKQLDSTLVQDYIRHFCEETVYVPRTRYKRLRALCVFLDFLLHQGLIAINPLENMLKASEFWKQPPRHPQSLYNLVKLHLQALKEAGILAGTIRGYQNCLRYLIEWCHEHKIYIASQLDETAIARYYNALPSLVSKKNGVPIAPLQQKNQISIISGFLAWLEDEKYTPANRFARQKSTLKQFWEQPSPMVLFAKKHFQWMELCEYANSTIANYQDAIRFFVEWASERGIHSPLEVKRSDIERYQAYTQRATQRTTNKPLSARYRFCYLMVVAQFFRWLSQQNYILADPTSAIELPKTPNRLPRNTLTTKEVQAILAQPDTTTPIGIRDRAIIETLYATAMRRTELATLQLIDLSLEEAVVFIREGKGCRDRYVPLTPAAMLWLDRYLTQVRPVLVKDPDEKNLFLHQFGRAMRPDNLAKVLRNHMLAANIQKSRGCHIFRHTVATLMLENGADIRYIQELLGHKNIVSTQVYTKVSIAKLKEVHENTHPAKGKTDRSKEILDLLGEPRQQ